MAHDPLYKVIFLNQGQVYEVYARGVSQGGLLGFVEVEDLVFGEKTKLVVDPSEERLKTEFEGVQRFFLPMHSVVRIDVVEKEGTARIREEEKSDKREELGKVTPFPILTPPAGGPSSSGSDKS